MKSMDWKVQKSIVFYTNEIAVTFSFILSLAVKTAKIYEKFLNRLLKYIGMQRAQKKLLLLFRS